MSVLLLDDIGLCLLRQLYEAWETCEAYAKTQHEHTYGTSKVDLTKIAAEYDALITMYIDHLRFIYGNRAYWPRLVHNLQITCNIGGELHDQSRGNLFARWIIAENSVKAYQRYIVQN